MNKIVLGFLGTVAAAGALGGVIAARHIPTYRKNAYVGEVPVGGLTQEEAAKALRIWWEEHKTKPVELHVKDPAISLGARTAGSVGITIDDTDSLTDIPVADLASTASDLVGGQESDRQNFPIKFKWLPTDLTPILAQFTKLAPPVAPAKVVFEKGAILRKHEVPSVELDVEQIPPVIAKAVADGSYVADLPLKESPKKVTDAELDEITDVVSSYTTRFPSSNRPRCSNIRLASSKLRGVIVMPGESLSFNGTVGRRTLKGGFKLAGVYKNGKHDVGVGGGICQVSTTLYNACLLSDLKIRQRSNHSLPVAYVPLGRDATVDYGDLDLLVQNTYTTPIAVDSYYEPGRLTFRILGKKDPSLSVKITRAEMEDWSEDVERVVDHHLKPGSQRVIEPGSRGHAVTTYRLIYHNGKLTRKDHLGRSSYGGQARVVAYNPAPAAPVAPPLAPGTAPAPPAIQPAGSVQQRPGPD
jgi:vancomycin resistance protein YoaR